MSERQTTILVVDDDAQIINFVSANLIARGYEVICTNNGLSALDKVVQARPNLVLLDLNLPEMDGLEVLRNLRQSLAIPAPVLPIIVVSALNDEKAKVEALDLGADDYLTKPFGINELLARVRVALRRADSILAATQAQSRAQPDQPDRYFQIGELNMDFVGRVVQRSGQELRMTPTEFNLLQFLVTNAGKVVTHRQLLQKVWGPEYGSETEYLRTFIKQLRRKIEPDPSKPVYLITEPGIGYRFRTP